VFGAATLGCTCGQKSSQRVRPTADDAETQDAEKKAKNRSKRVVCLLTRGCLISVRCGLATALWLLSPSLARYGIETVCGTTRSGRRGTRPQCCAHGITRGEVETPCTPTSGPRPCLARRGAGAIRIHLHPFALPHGRLAYETEKIPSAP
jgi:hypothetical protein